MIATDPREEQIAAPLSCERVQSSASRIERASEQIGRSRPRRRRPLVRPLAFFAERNECQRGGAIAVWGYGDPILDSDALNLTLHDLTAARSRLTGFPSGSCCWRVPDDSVSVDEVQLPT